MNYNKIEFFAAYGTKEQLPESNLPEICFAGRSNVGKSSLINKIVGKKALAKTGSKPGKTVTINFFSAENLYLVDLPGYGYAKISFEEKERFATLMEGYFTTNRNIRHGFALVDMRREPTNLDFSMFDLFKDYNIPFTVVLTKCDKLNKGEYQKNLAEIKEMLSCYVKADDIVPFSATKNIGVETIREIIEKNC